MTSGIVELNTFIGIVMIASLIVAICAGKSIAWYRQRRYLNLL